MTNLVPSAADERQVLRPKVGLERTDDAGHALEPTFVDRRSRAQAKRNTVHDDRDLRRERLDRTQLSLGRLEQVISDHLEDVDLVAVRQDAGR